MLRTHVEDELLGLEALVAVDDRQLDPGGILDRSDLAVDGGQVLTRP
ncbi:MAG: hypothetical protein M3Z65_01375 [Chloroflexota bacterium]|nr:hypothetical protein [Chloroflexota bacterium]